MRTVSRGFSRWRAGKQLIKTVITSSVGRICVLGILSKDVFGRRTSTGSEAFSLFICLDVKRFVVLSFFALIKTIYRRVWTKPLPNDAKSPLPVDVHRDARASTATHVNRKLSLLTFYMPRRQKICIANFLCSDKDDLPKSLNQATAQWCKKSTSGWRPSRKKAIA